MKKFFEKIFRLPLEGKLSPKVTDEVENTLNEKHLIRQASLTPSPRGEGSRRGFTIVELVIALSVIVIVSGISIGVVAVNNKTYGETIDMIEATNIAENAIECFRYAKNNSLTDDEFIELLKGTGVTPVKDGDNEDSYLVIQNDLEVKIVITGNTIAVSAKNSNDDNLFEDTVTYTVR